MLMICVACRDEDGRKPFIVPNDATGRAIMMEHIKNEHEEK